MNMLFSPAAAIFEVSRRCAEQRLDTVCDGASYCEAEAHHVQ